MGARQSSTQGSVSNTSSPRVHGSGSSSSNSGSNVGLNGSNLASGSNSHNSAATTTTTNRQYRMITLSSSSSSATTQNTATNRHQTGNHTDSRQRSRSFANGNSNNNNNNNGTVNVQSIMTIPKTNEGFIISTTPDSDTSTEDIPFGHRAFSAHSLPVQFVNFNVVKCPVCSKTVPPEDVECHLVMCLTKPRISYNEDTLNEDKGECVICLDDLNQGDTIARLPCLCIYHKSCIDAWFEVNRSCPEHPSD